MKRLASRFSIQPPELLGTEAQRKDHRPTKGQGATRSRGLAAEAPRMSVSVAENAEVLHPSSRSGLRMTIQDKIQASLKRIATAGHFRFCADKIRGRYHQPFMSSSLSRKRVYEWMTASLVRSMVLRKSCRVCWRASTCFRANLTQADAVSSLLLSVMDHPQGPYCRMVDITPLLSGLSRRRALRGSHGG